MIIHDRREFAKFEKEKMNAKWDTVSHIGAAGATVQLDVTRGADNGHLALFKIFLSVFILVSCLQQD